MFNRYHRELENEEQQLPVLEAFADKKIMPSSYNMLHFLSYHNKNRSADFAMSFNTPYIADCFDNRPLMIAMVRNSNKMVKNIVQNAVDNEKLLKKITGFELCQIIEFSPANLKDFFDAAIIVVGDNRIPKFGKVNESPSFFLDEKDELEYETDLKQVATWREVDPTLKIRDELPVAL